ncbi:hypothetical protein H744_2c3255 [Photobacterium gaetbulicola Gung47]|uniref:Uncharacterized protein n=1 Tax=Photobacterium gaetbulicola Gung47 TaxID=658445 RepID=A0A0C5WU17_9GAMM|nr:hypothetical protein H744_2c3255 [Photobacterium gaetbulicola Gung47]
MFFSRAHEGVASTNQTAYRVGFSHGRQRLFGRVHQLGIRSKCCWLLGHLADLVTEGCNIGIVVTDLGRDHHITHIQAAVEATGRPRIEHDIRLEDFKQNRSAHSCSHFADARLQQYHVGAVECTGVERTARFVVRFAVRQLIFKDGNFLLHRADNADFHQYSLLLGNKPPVRGRWEWLDCNMREQDNAKLPSG